jgi:hypothetical protein
MQLTSLLGGTARVPSEVHKLDVALVVETVLEPCTRVLARDHTLEPG